ncbi:ribonuclease H-like protein [Sporormia fimetaria CBS 119925]|uniref:ribonuclease H n=1 Tax=Sporormia fimetaria CBS 119925 TaxID=1340428 RepID=A0A6A6V468_9PLEO|nr:ribonuclease H-like protein [Sporormia fimetaria CBS 119925]
MFASLTDAEAFLEGGNGTSSKARPAQEKWYGVAVGHIPGVYTDYEEVKRQIRGYPGSKQQRFATREEAQAFVDGRGTPGTGSVSNVNIAASALKEDVASELSSLPGTGSRRKTPKLTENAAKKQKKNEPPPPAILDNGEIEPGTGPLPPDAQDGFDRTIVLRADTGRIEYKTEEELAARKWQPTGDFRGPLVIHTDGAAPKNGQVGAVAGIGVYFGPQNPNNVSAWLGEGRQTNQRAELAAIKRAVHIAPIDREALIRSDSNYSIQCVTTWFQRWESNDWKTAGGKAVENRDLIEPIIERLRERKMAGADTKFEWVKGHGTDAGNIAADRLAVQGAEIGRRTMLERAAQEKEEEQRLADEAPDAEDEWAFVKELKKQREAEKGESAPGLR